MDTPFQTVERLRTQATELEVLGHPESKALAQDWLFLHDPTPLTQEWLGAVASSYSYKEVGQNKLGEYDLAPENHQVWVKMYNGHFSLWFFEDHIMDLSTQGQVAMVCRLLQLWPASTLNEKAHA